MSPVAIGKGVRPEVEDRARSSRRLDREGTPYGTGKSRQAFLFLKTEETQNCEGRAHLFHLPSLRHAQLLPGSHPSPVSSEAKWPQHSYSEHYLIAVSPGTLVYVS